MADSLISSNPQRTVFSHAGERLSSCPQETTTVAEFEVARNRELTRLNVRMFSITSKEFSHL